MIVQSQNKVLTILDRPAEADAFEWLPGQIDIDISDSAEYAILSRCQSTQVKRLIIKTYQTNHPNRAFNQV